jgi:hypothetical protein
MSGESVVDVLGRLVRRMIDLLGSAVRPVIDVLRGVIHITIEGRPMMGTIVVMAVM